MSTRFVILALFVLAVTLAALACDSSPERTSPPLTSPPPTGTEPPSTAQPPTPPAPTGVLRPTLGPITYSSQVDGYMVVAPEALYSGQTHDISVSLLRGADPAEGTVRLVLSDGDRVLAEASQFVQGSGTVSLAVPEGSAGSHILRVSGEGTGGGSFEDSTTILVQDPPVILFLETDKPIYKPGQEIRIRALRLDSDLKPMAGPVTVEIQDAKGIKVYKQAVEADEYGMASASLPLSNEPNLGVWQLTGLSGGQSFELDVRVEEYVLPKYEIAVDLPRDWTLLDDTVTGTVTAEYSFGKPVRGEVEVTAHRYVGMWEEYATFTKEIDGQTAFELPAPGYVAGTPTAGGQGNLQVNFTVREQGTEYLEQTSLLLTVADSPVNLQLIPASSWFSPGLPFSLLLVAETPGNEPVDAGTRIFVEYYGQDLEPIDSETLRAETTGGKALVELSPPSDAVAMTVTAETDQDYAQLALQASYSPSGNFIHLEQTGESLLKVGGQATFRVHSTSEARTFYYEVLSRGRVVFSGTARTPEIVFALTPEMAPSARLVAYQILPNNEVAADYLPFDVTAGYPMQVSAGFSVEEARPGDSVDILVNTEGLARVGLAAVDRSVFILAENRVNLQQVFAELERLYAAPQLEAHLVEFLPDRVITRGAADTFRQAGLITLSNRTAPDGQQFSRPAPTAPPPTAMPMAAAAPASAIWRWRRAPSPFPPAWLRWSG